jgi:hypothetical protein
MGSCRWGQHAVWFLGFWAVKRLFIKKSEGARNRVYWWAITYLLTHQKKPGFSHPGGLNNYLETVSKVDAEAATFQQLVPLI